MFTTLLLILYTILVLIFSSYFQQKWKWRSVSHINGPVSLPLLGNVLEFGTNPAAILKNLQRLLNNYGKKEGIIKLSLGLNSCYLIIVDPTLTEFFLSCPKILKKNINYDLARPWIRNGLIISTGAYWQKRRKVITSAFHLNILKQFVPIFNVEAETLINILLKEVDKDVVDIYPYIVTYTLDCICETAMGTSVNAQDNPTNEYVQAVENMFNIFISRTYSVWKGVDFLFQFSKEYQLQKQCLKTIHNFTKSVIKKRRKELLTASVNAENGSKNKDDVGIKKRQVFLDLLLNTTIDNKPLSDDDIAEEVDTFMVAGHETSSSTISFALFELSRNPEIQNQVYDEIKEMFQTNKEQPSTLTDLNNLKYLELVIKETLRLYPAVPYFARDLEDNITYKGTTFPKGAQLVFFPYYMQRRPDLFENPEKFNPERFSPENSTIQTPFSYIPFSAGPRNCIGQKFAMYEVKCVIAKIIQNFEILPVDKKYDLVLSAEITLKSANGVNIKLRKRT